MIRQELFTQIGLDSGALTMLGAIIHPLTEPGVYRGSVQLHDVEVAHFYLTVDESANETQVDVDLASVHGEQSEGEEECSCEETADARAVQPGGFLVLHVGSGRGGYAVVLAAGKGMDRNVAFDSRRLERDDRFAATVLRPGRYTVMNTETRARGSLLVSYPEVGTKPYEPGEPVTVTVGEKQLQPDNVEVGAAQSQVYLAEGPTRIVIELEEPIDLEPERDSPIHSVKRPRKVTQQRKR